MRDSIALFSNIVEITLNQRINQSFSIIKKNLDPFLCLNTRLNTLLGHALFICIQADKISTNSKFCPTFNQNLCPTLSRNHHIDASLRQCHPLESCSSPGNEASEVRQSPVVIQASEPLHFLLSGYLQGSCFSFYGSGGQSLCIQLLLDVLVLR